MKFSKETPVFLLLSILLFSSCSKKIDPDTSLIRNKGSDIDSTTGVGGFNTGTGDDFSIAGDPLLGINDDLLAPRGNALDAFSDPLNTIRPFEPVYFGFDQYNINASERDKLTEIASFLKDNPKARLLVEGYCDWKGTPAYNKSLGDRRATTVKSYLTDLGADQSRIETVSIGDESAIPNADGEQAKLDRRAAFVVTKGS
jgi:peptidoglycan-associated lipoprotein|tara:strand:- start:947 stop:1546 length:600 start_codon:yes stop_codon:yes gene_type:complete